MPTEQCANQGSQSSQFPAALERLQAAMDRRTVQPKESTQATLAAIGQKVQLLEEKLEAQAQSRPQVSQLQGQGKAHQLVMLGDA